MTQAPSPTSAGSGTGGSSAAVPGPTAAVPDPTPPVPEPGACAAALPASWSQVLRTSVVTPAADESLAVRWADDPGRLLQFGPGGSRHELAWVEQGQELSEARVLHGFPTAESEVASAASDQRFLAYVVTTEFIMDSPWLLYVWEIGSEEGPVLVSQSPAGEDGRPLFGPYPYVRVGDGVVVWTQAVSAQDGGLPFQTALMSHDARSGETEELSRGFYANPMTAPPLVVMRGAERATGAPPELFAFDTEVGDLVDPPAWVAAEDAACFVADGGTTVWVSDGLKELWVHRPGWAQPWRAVVATAEVPSVEHPQIVGDIVIYKSMGEDQELMALDLRTRATAPITRLGSARAFGSTFVIGMPPPGETEVDKATWRSENVVVKADAFAEPMPCD